MKNNITLKLVGIIISAVGYGGSITVLIGELWFPGIVCFIGLAIVVKCLINERKVTSNSHTMFLGQTGSDYPYPHTFRKGKNLSEKTIKQLLKREKND